MELYIETLTGTTFELRVSPFETIISVKSKIQTLEGIPTSQQHLIWNNQELDDNSCLTDYNIQDGATLKMVTAMRGGPINTRRIPMEDPAMREVADYMEANRDEIFEKLPSNQPVTLLVLKEGDIYNFFRVVDRGDGTITPMSESLSGAASVCNLYEDDDEVECYRASRATLASPTFRTLVNKEKVEENDKTKQKMTVIRAKMDNTAVKKPKKKNGGFIPRPPSSHRPASTRRLHRLSATSQRLASTSFNRPPLLPPVGHQDPYHPQESSKMPKISLHAHSINGELSRSFSRTELSRLLRQASVTNSVSDNQQELTSRQSARLRRSGSASKLHQRYIQSHNKMNSAQEQDAHKPVVITSTDSLNNVNTNASLVLSSSGEVMKIPFVNKNDSECNVNTVPFRKGCDSSTQTDNIDSHLAQRLDGSLNLSATSRVLSAAGKAAVNSDDFPHKPPPTIMEELTSPTIDSDPSEAADTASKRKLVSISTNTESSLHRGIPRFNHQMSAPNPPTEASTFCRTQSPKVLQTGLLLTDNNTTRGKSGLLRQISIERLGTSKLISTQSTVSGINLPSPPGSVRTGVRRSGPTSAGLAQNGKIRDGRIPDSRLLSARLQPVLSPTHRLPPVKSKKKSSKRCFICAKKTGLALSFSCRCGHNFCSLHRYAEAHNCDFDYKSEGRKLIEQNNPVITAPKLPKI